MTYAAPAIHLEGIGRTIRPHVWSRPKTLLHDVTFALEQGEMCALLGANGAGKTTLLRVLLGLAQATCGSGTLLGAPIGSRASRRAVGFLPERSCLTATATPMESCTLAAELSGLAPRAARRAAEVALSRLGVRDVAHRRMQHFSKGMLQRVGLAQAIVHAPRLLLLDEPLSGLDPPARHDVRNLLSEERGRGASILFATHVLSDVVTSCDRAVVLVAGELSHHGSPTELLAAAEVRANAEGRHNEVEVSFGNVGTDAAAATIAAAQLRASHVVHFGEQWRVRVAGIARANDLIDRVRAAGGTVLSVEQDARALEILLAPRAVGLASAKAGPAGHASAAPGAAKANKNEPLSEVSR